MANRRIILKRGTATTWTGSNPILKNGEPGYDITNKALKVGDGETAWNSLPWVKDYTSILQGSGVPSSGAGEVGDWYFRTGVWDVYEKTGVSTWTLRGNIQGGEGPDGPEGPQGESGTSSRWHQGSGAPDGSLGIVYDWYIRLSNYDIYEKTGVSTWTARGTIKGATGATGSGGGGSEGYYLLEAFGSISSTVNSLTAIQGAIDAAHSDGGGTVLFIKDQLVAWDGDIVHKDGVNVIGASFSPYLSVTNGLKALSGSARYRYGDLSGPGANPYPGILSTLNIDGNGVGGSAELFRAECVDTAIYNIQLQNGVGDGFMWAAAQNSTLSESNVYNFPNGAVLGFRNRDDGSTNTQGAGSCRVDHCHIMAGNILVRSDYVPNDIGTTYGAGNHDCYVTDSILEQYQTSYYTLVHQADGEIQFDKTVITGSSGTTNTSSAVILVENAIRPTSFTKLTLTNSYIGGGAAHPADAIRSKSYGLANIVRLFGMTNIANVTTALCDDRGGGGLGTIGGFYGEVDFVGSIAVSRGINGGSGASFVNVKRQGIRFVMDATQATPLQFRRDGENNNRSSIDRDGGGRWSNGTDALTRGSLVPTFSASAGTQPSDTMTASGRWTFADGMARTASFSLLNADGAVTIDSQLTSYHVISFLATGADATSVTISNAVENAELRLCLVGTGINTITWPTGGSAINWTDSVVPQPEDAKVKFVTITYLNGHWYQIGGSAVASGGGGAAYVPVTATLAGGTYTVNPVSGTDFYLTATANTTLALDAGAVAGDAVTVNIIQDATGGRVISLPGTWKGVSDVVLSTVANHYDVLLVWVTPIGTHVKLVQTGV